MQLHVAIISIYKKLTNKMLTGWQASWKLYVEMILPSGTEEYFNKKKTLNTKCWGVRAIALPPLTVLKISLFISLFFVLKKMILIIALYAIVGKFHYSSPQRSTSENESIIALYAIVRKFHYSSP